MIDEVARARRARQARDGLEPWMTKQQIAEHLGFSTRWVEIRMREGLPSSTMGGRRRYLASEVEAWLRTR